MTEVLSPAPSSAASPRPRSPPRRDPTSPPTTSEPQEKSRPQSMSFPAFHSSLPYALVRDFAYQPFDPMHYGTPPDPPSGTTTPGSEWNSSRRLSDPSESTGGWGSWKPDSLDNSELPSTSFGEDGEPSRKHRRSRSHANMSDWERGRRGSAQRRSRGGSGDRDMFHFGSSSGSQSLDPAGSESLRHSRAGNSRRDSHFAATLPSRTFHNSTGGPQPRQRRAGEDEDVIPLDAESSSHAHSPQRASMGPEDELFAGESLALYAFEPENPNELRLKEGQIILVSYRHGQGWLVAEDPLTGEQGLVPEEYVRLVREIEGWDSERGTFIDADVDMDGDAEDDGDESTEVAEDSTMEDDQSRPNSSRENGRQGESSGSGFEGAGEEAMLTDSPPEIEMDSKAAIFQQQQRDALKDASGESRQDSAHADR